MEPKELPRLRIYNRDYFIEISKKCDGKHEEILDEILITPNKQSYSPSPRIEERKIVQSNRIKKTIERLLGCTKVNLNQTEILEQPGMAYSLFMPSTQRVYKNLALLKALTRQEQMKYYTKFHLRPIEFSQHLSRFHAAQF
eukprot:TRINITY_DN35151_c0_g1_i2.p1 TRINITY_DN35151_c0_g1~~TRINITY_DN35151_c0_g1_i2.p1  ORF type:complete len:141 (-),score=11.82 TRINITY_DN35151_c0_g1_i2:97-519(-)